MGSQGTGTGVSRDVVLDAGALIAFERGDENVKSILRGVLATKAQVIIPASTLAQVWRGGPAAAPLARLADGSEIDELDQERAKEIGMRLGSRAASDVADAQVVCSAIERGAMIATSDVDDIRALAHPGERLIVIAV